MAELESPHDAIVARVKQTRDVADQMGRVLKAIGKPLTDLSRKDIWTDVGAVMAAWQKLDKVTLPEGDLKTAVGALSQALQAHLVEEERKLKFYFGRDLREAAGRAGLAFAPLTTDPPEFRLGVFTVGVDLPRRAAVVRYARNDLLRVPLNADAIVEAVQKQHAALEGKGFDPTRYFEQVLGAWQVRLHRAGQPFGARVDLVDLLPEIAFVRQGTAFLEDPQRENFVPYSRVQMAYDLARLRRAGKLAHNGLRLSLGSATGGSTKQKSRVLYLEDERGNGQWYLSIRFAREGEEG
jgi:hypothetical protein